MTEYTQAEASEFEWPERWSDSVDAPPLARDFLEQVERFQPTAQARSPRLSPWRIGGSLLAVAALAALIWWPRAGTPGDSVALVPTNDPLPAPAPSSPGIAIPSSSVGMPSAPTERAAPSNDVVLAPPRGHGPTPATRVAMGVLHVMTLPMVAVEVDGVAHGNAPQRVSLRPGSHRVRLTRPELGIDATETVEIVAGETLRLARSFDVPSPPRRVPSAATPTPTPTPAPTPGTPTTDGSHYSVARACAIRGDHACVIANLRGHCTTAREFELFIASLRTTGGRDRDVESSMRTYLTRFPTGRQAAHYRQYLVAHYER